jgi:hypothetical protein
MMTAALITTRPGLVLLWYSHFGKYWLLKNRNEIIL